MAESDRVRYPTMAVSGSSPSPTARLIAAIQACGKNTGASARSNTPAANRNKIANNFSACIYRSTQSKRLSHSTDYCIPLVTRHKPPWCLSKTRRLVQLGLPETANLAAVLAEPGDSG